MTSVSSTWATTSPSSACGQRVILKFWKRINDRVAFTPVSIYQTLALCFQTNLQAADQTTPQTLPRVPLAPQVEGNFQPVSGKASWSESVRSVCLWTTVRIIPAHHPQLSQWWTTAKCSSGSSCSREHTWVEFIKCQTNTTKQQTQQRTWENKNYTVSLFVENKRKTQRNKESRNRAKYLKNRDKRKNKLTNEKIYMKPPSSEPMVNENGIVVASLNCRGLAENLKRQHLIHLMKTHQIDLVALQETKQKTRGPTYSLNVQRISIFPQGSLFWVPSLSLHSHISELLMKTLPLSSLKWQMMNSKSRWFSKKSINTLFYREKVCQQLSCEQNISQFLGALCVMVGTRILALPGMWGAKLPTSTADILIKSIHCR